jgi:hypothetical protein
MVTLGIICIICIVGFIGCGMTSKDGRTQAHENQPLSSSLVLFNKFQSFYNCVWQENCPWR